MIAQQQIPIIVHTDSHPITVYALVGPSGTGKSHRAIKIAHDYHADLIIDDGLIIRGNHILVGHTAKREATRIGAIKAALFMDKKLAEQAQQAILKAAPQSILILGTSKGMVDKISLALHLPRITRYISIEEVSSKEEIEKARFMRNKYSKHVIPAPTMEVKKTFPGTFIDPIKVFLKPHNKNNDRSWQEQSVVRPTFTFYGHLTISQNALISIVAITAKEIEGIKSIGKINIIQNDTKVTITLHPVLYYGINLPNTSKIIQSAIRQKVEYMTGLVVEAVNIIVKDLYFPKQRGIGQKK